MKFSHIAGHTFESSGLSATSVVVDLGVNHGQFSSGIIQRYGCRVYGVEPDPRPYIDAKRILGNRAVHAALSDRVGKTTFHLAAYDQCSSLFKHGVDSTGSIEVDQFTLEGLLSHFDIQQVDLVKMDIEGAEDLVLPSLDARLAKRIAQITVEFHGGPAKSALESVRNCEDHLTPLGFRKLDFSYETPYHDILFVHESFHRVGWLTHHLLQPLSRLSSGLYRSFRFQKSS